MVRILSVKVCKPILIIMKPDAYVNKHSHRSMPTKCIATSLLYNAVNMLAIPMIRRLNCDTTKAPTRGILGG